MILSAVILSLLSLLVATEPEAPGSTTPPSTEPPLRPLRKVNADRDDPPQSGQIAA